MLCCVRLILYRDYSQEATTKFTLIETNVSHLRLSHGFGLTMRKVMPALYYRNSQCFVSIVKHDKSVLYFEHSNVPSIGRCDCVIMM